MPRPRNNMSCSVEDCERKVTARGWCAMHYSRWWSHGDTRAAAPPRMRNEGNLCSIDECDSAAKTRGFCLNHYARFLKYGSPTGAGKFYDPNSYGASHYRVRKLWGTANQYGCISCSSKAKEWAYDGLDPEHQYGPAMSSGSWSYYSLWPEFYAPMCQRCHRSMDRALAQRELREYREWKVLNPGVALPMSKPKLRLLNCV